MPEIMVNAIAIVVLALIVGGASFYIYKEKKKGVKCIGCPNAKHCTKAACGGNKRLC